MGTEAAARVTRILLIEDDPDDAWLVEKYLSKCNSPENRFDLVRADRLKTGLDCLSKEKFHLVLLDLTLPDSEKLDTFVSVREAAPNVPVVICSGLHDQQVAIEAIGKGAQDYVLKGQIDQAMFERVIRYALERRRVQEMKEEFIGKVIHDLRSPLVISREAVALILDGFFGEVSKEQREFLTMAVNTLGKLNRMIDDLLNVTKIELGKVELQKERVDMAEITREACAGFDPMAKKKNLEMKVRVPSAPVSIFADRDKISQAWMNLLSNAVKYTERGSIEVTVQDRGDQVECRVKDTGCGIAEKDMDQMFSQFQRFGANDRPKVEGTGLGLAITKGIILAHQGRIWAQSKLGEGTEISFTLPKG